MISRRVPRMVALLAAGALLLVAAVPASADTWYSGQRTFGNVSVEPAINMADGSQIFLLTPKGAQTNANPRAHAPLYLVMYPGTSSVPASTLNCSPTNCDHANAFPPYGAAGYKGHDHLVGLPHTGDFNVAWDVYIIAFTPKGFGDGAINTRILTMDKLNEAIAAGDVAPPIDFHFAFNCSSTSAATYLKGTPFTTN